MKYLEAFRLASKQRPELFGYDSSEGADLWGDDDATPEDLIQSREDDLRLLQEEADRFGQ